MTHYSPFVESSGDSLKILALPRQLTGALLALFCGIPKKVCQKRRTILGQNKATSAPRRAEVKKDPFLELWLGCTGHVENIARLYLVYRGQNDKT